MLRIAISQLNLSVGNSESNFSKNAIKILQTAKLASQAKADLLITPELSLCSYPPGDLLLRKDFIETCELNLAKLRLQFAAWPQLTAIVGHPAFISQSPQLVANRASIINASATIDLFYDKQNLANYGVFNEARYFTAGRKNLVFTINKIKIGLLICQDIWLSQPAVDLVNLGAQLIIVINASVYTINKDKEREALLRKRANETGLPYIYCNLVGGQDEFIFDGTSFVTNRQGEIVLRLPSFTEAFSIIDANIIDEIIDDSCKNHIEFSITNNKYHEKNKDQYSAFEHTQPIEKIYRALQLSLKDFVLKNKFDTVVLGLSGGIDSALVACLAADTLGASKVKAFMLPSIYTSSASLCDARVLAKNLNIFYREIPINNAVSSFTASLENIFRDFVIKKTSNKDADLIENYSNTNENIQARVRATMLMAIANKYHSLLLNTGNKSEFAVGYCTLYGDMAGGFAVLKDVSKTLVYELSIWRAAFPQNQIPENILTKAPSAELRENQTDQDSLPPYDILDSIIHSYVEENHSKNQLLKKHQKEVVDLVLKLIKSSEHKRHQAPPGPKITNRAFGADWRYPISAE